MRLSPKYIFLGIVVLGLPFAVVVGWTLGAPAQSPTPVSAPQGAGTLGAAPELATGPAPVTTDDRPARGRRPAGSSAAPSAVPSAAPPISVAPVPGGTSFPPLPILTDPPVPTPAHVTSAPASPSATPSAEPSGDPGGSVVERVVRRS